jgi:hypothetical protein
MPAPVNFDVCRIAFGHASNLTDIKDVSLEG